MVMMLNLQPQADDDDLPQYFSIHNQHFAYIFIDEKT
jgi:hypothetical protein